MSKADDPYPVQSSHYALDQSEKGKAVSYPPSPLFDDKLRLPRNGVPIDLNAWATLLRFDPDQHGTETLDVNKRIAAGWTYFGQLMSHDLSCLRGLYVDAEDPHRALGHFSPGLDLHTLYGFGPHVQAGLYELAKDPVHGYDFRGVRFVLESYQPTLGKMVDDVPRKDMLLPLIADARNDDNFILSQLLCVFMRFHNAVAEYFHRQSKGGLIGEALFEKTRGFVAWTYQWLVVHEYLAKLAPDGLVTSLLQSLQEGHTKGFVLLNHKLGEAPTLTPEFIHAAMRIGHSQVRGAYELNAQQQHVELFGEAEGKPDLRGFKRDTRRGAPDWALFFGTKEAQKSRLMDLLIAEPLHKLPFPPKLGENLGALNLKRSVEMGLVLPGDTQQLFRTRLGISAAINPDIIRAYYSTHRLNQATQTWLERLCAVEHWPLWAYVLMEARIYGCQPAEYRGSTQPSQTLGPLGAHIITEQILWILSQSKSAFLQRRGFDWTPDKEIADIQNIPSYTSPFTIDTLIAIADNGIPVHH